MRKKNLSKEGRGRWDDEPSLLDFTYREYACRITRHMLGALNGYVAIDVDHAFHAVDYFDVNVSVHGGVTYASYELPLTAITDVLNNKEIYIKSPYLNVSKRAWWVGFDCAHAGDIIPKMSRGIQDIMDTYKDIEFVKAELKQLVDQLIEREFV